MSGWKAKAVLLGFSLVVGFLLAEVAVRIAAPQVFPIHPVGLYVEDPDLGYALAPGFVGLLERSEFRDTLRIGPEGFRGPAVGPAMGEGTFTVMVLGDSHAFGFGVEEDETFPFRLERMLQSARPGAAVRVVNAAVPGYGTADQLAMLRSRGPGLEPDAVVVAFLSVNDLLENSTPASTWARIDDGMLTSREGSVTTTASVLRRFEMWIKRTSHLASLVSNAAGYWLTRLGVAGQGGALWGEDFSPEQRQLGTDLLVEIGDVADSLGATALLLYTTGQASVLQPEYEHLPSRSVVSEAAGVAGVDWIDVTEHMRERPDRMAFFYPADGHWAAEGHRVVAEIVAERLAPEIPDPR